MNYNHTSLQVTSEQQIKVLRKAAEYTTQLNRFIYKMKTCITYLHSDHDIHVQKKFLHHADDAVESNLNLDDNRYRGHQSYYNASIWLHLLQFQTNDKHSICNLERQEAMEVKRSNDSVIA